VPPAWVGRLAVEWGNTTRRALAHHLVVGPCPGDDPWIAFPGGFYVSQPACVELIVRVANIDHEVSVGVGAPCPGQKPPPQPTEP
jgi:hypothetical protein